MATISGSVSPSINAFSIGEHSFALVNNSIACFAVLPFFAKPGTSLTLYFIWLPVLLLYCILPYGPQTGMAYINWSPGLGIPVSFSISSASRNFSSSSSASWASIASISACSSRLVAISAASAVWTSLCDVDGGRASLLLLFVAYLRIIPAKNALLFPTDLARSPSANSFTISVPSLVENVAREFNSKTSIPSLLAFGWLLLAPFLFPAAVAVGVAVETVG
mmetsp:Transcript_22526/g.37629  ORF Transcript_22526/g.37629 Transcript_22526/m.37629 type:complete len:221 (-) Transcript_22526:505-1167(-)